MCPLALQLLDTGAQMQWIVPGNVAVGKAVVDMVSTVISNELKIAHGMPCFSEKFSQDL